MGDFDSILLLNSLRVALNSLDQNPELDGIHLGIREIARSIARGDRVSRAWREDSN